jgi:putative oxidoreductase
MPVQRLVKSLLDSTAPSTVLLVRLMVGGVFLSEGIQKFLFPADVGSGRFLRIGLPAPEFLATWVAVWEITAGMLILLGMLTRLAVVPMIVNMLVAIAVTKIPILINDGFWKMAHEARTDYSMLLSSIFLLIVGGGAWSLDNYLMGRLDGSSNTHQTMR